VRSKRVFLYIGFFPSRFQIFLVQDLIMRWRRRLVGEIFVLTLLLFLLVEERIWKWSLFWNEYVRDGKINDE